MLWPIARDPLRYWNPAEEVATPVPPPARGRRALTSPANRMRRSPPPPAEEAGGGDGTHPRFSPAACDHPPPPFPPKRAQNPPRSPPSPGEPLGAGGRRRLLRRLVRRRSRRRRLLLGALLRPLALAREELRLELLRRRELRQEALVDRQVSVDLGWGGKIWSRSVDDWPGGEMLGRQGPVGLRSPAIGGRRRADIDMGECVWGRGGRVGGGEGAGCTLAIGTPAAAASLLRAVGSVAFTSSCEGRRSGGNGRVRRGPRMVGGRGAAGAQRKGANKVPGARWGMGAYKEAEEADRHELAVGELAGVGAGLQLDDGVHLARGVDRALQVARGQVGTGEETWHLPAPILVGPGRPRPCAEVLLWRVDPGRTADWAAAVRAAASLRN